MTAALQFSAATLGNDELAVAFGTAISLPNYISHCSVPSLCIHVLDLSDATLIIVTLITCVKALYDD